MIYRNYFRYEINIRNIFSYTSDNARNVVKLGEDISKLYIANRNNLKDVDEEYITKIDKENEEILEYIDENIDNKSKVFAKVKCSCHTIELCINDACKEENIIKINKASDSVIKLLRTPFMTDTLEKCGHHRPTISCTTRWHSLFDSLSSLLNLKEFCIKNQGSIKELFLSESEWSDINLWKNALQPFSQCITLMQNEQMTMSDFYGLYVLLLANLDSVDNIYSKLLTEILNKRCNNIINTELMRGCIYLDPRFQAFF